jgi:hypothetical protein
MEECPVRIDTSKPHPARVYDWLLGGKDNYPVDQRVGAALPEQSRRSAARNREFMHRAAAWLAARGVDQFLDIARARLDFDRPVALSLIALMHFLPDTENPYALTRTLLSALPSGSYLVLSHASSDIFPELSAQVTAEYAKGGIRLGFRDRAGVERFFEGLELVEPGLVTATEWFKDGEVPAAEKSGIYAGVARLP